MGLLNHTNEVIDLIRKKTDRVMLFYSCGKDSIALLDLLAKKFTHITAVFMYFVPGLDHIEKYIRDARVRYPNVEITQKPHWNLTYIHKDGLYCVPDPDIKLKTLKDINEEVRVETGLEWTFYGMKKADSLQRRVMLMGYEMEAINEKTKNVYPLSHWKNGDVLRYIRDNNLPQPIIYGKKASNGVGFNVDSLLWMRENYPQDYKKIITAYPMAQVILFQYDQKQKTA